MKFNKRFTLALFDAEWNNHKDLAEQFQKVAKEYYKDDFEFYTFNVDENPKLAKEFKISNVPAICYFYRGYFKKVVIGNNQNIKEQIKWLRMGCMELPFVPENCLVCGAKWKGGCAVPGTRFPGKGVRVFFNCGASMSIIDAEKELGHINGNQDDCFFIRFKNCHGDFPESQSDENSISS